MSGIALAWRAAAAAAAPGLRVLLRRRAARGKEIAARLPEREGIEAGPRPAGTLVWLHAASLGESQSVLPVVEHLVAEGATVLMTSGTVTSARFLGERFAEARFAGAGAGGRALHRFVPLDVPRWAARFLEHWRPDAAGFVESELWPNLLAGCRARRVPVMLVNGRMSARSFRGWRRVPGFAAVVLGTFERVQAQTAGDAERLAALGAQGMETPGNLKLAAPALPVDEAALAALRAEIGARPVWLAASTHPGEEAVAGAVHRALAAAHPGLLTIVAPRHPERGPAVADALVQDGLAVARRGLGEGPGDGVWVVDTIGELGLWYRLAPVVFVGGSLVPMGGQNPLEAARLGAAVAMGPAVENCAESVARLEEAGGLTVVADAAGLAAWVDGMLREPERRAAAGAGARSAADSEAGLPGRVASVLLGLAGR